MEPTTDIISVLYGDRADLNRCVKSGKKRTPFSEEHKANMAKALIGNTRHKGKMMSLESRQRNPYL